MTKSLFIILGNQLFDKAYLEKFKDSTFVMIEDYGLCTYEKHHKLKILHVLSSMRSHAETLKRINIRSNIFRARKILNDLMKKN